MPGPCPQTDPSLGAGHRQAPIDRALGPCLQIDPSPETDLHPEPIDQPHGAGQPRRGSPAAHLAEAGPVWGAEAGALLAALEVEACEAALEAEACEAVDAGADAAAEGARMLP